MAKYNSNEIANINSYSWGTSRTLIEYFYRWVTRSNYFLSFSTIRISNVCFSFTDQPFFRRNITKAKRLAALSGEVNFTQGWILICTGITLPVVTNISGQRIIRICRLRTISHALLFFWIETSESVPHILRCLCKRGRYCRCIIVI